MEIRSIVLFRGLHREIGSYFICWEPIRTRNESFSSLSRDSHGGHRVTPVHALIYWSPIAPFFLDIHDTIASCLFSAQGGDRSPLRRTIVRIIGHAGDFDYFYTQLRASSICVPRVYEFYRKIHYQARSGATYKILGDESVSYTSTRAVKFYKLVARLAEVMIGTTRGATLAGSSNYQENRLLARCIVKSRWKLRGNEASYVPVILFRANKRARMRVMAHGRDKYKDTDGKERDYRVYSYYVMSKPTHPSYDRWHVAASFSPMNMRAMARTHA